MYFVIMLKLLLQSKLFAIMYVESTVQTFYLYKGHSVLQVQTTLIRLDTTIQSTRIDPNCTAILLL